MKKDLANPFMFKECFFCGTENPDSLRLRFYWDEETLDVSTELSLPKRFAGQGKIIHGGFQMGILDEIMGWTAVVLNKTMVVTSDTQVKFIKPLYVEEKITAVSKLISVKGPKIRVAGELQNAKGEVCTLATAIFHIIPENKFQSLIEGK